MSKQSLELTATLTNAQIVTGITNAILRRNDYKKVVADGPEYAPYLTIDRSVEDERLWGNLRCASDEFLNLLEEALERGWNPDVAAENLEKPDYRRKPL